jgi:hypothetical protein
VRSGLAESVGDGEAFGGEQLPGLGAPVVSFAGGGEDAVLPAGQLVVADDLAPPGLRGLG